MWKRRSISRHKEAHRSQPRRHHPLLRHLWKDLQVERWLKASQEGQPFQFLPSIKDVFIIVMLCVLWSIHRSKVKISRRVIFCKIRNFTVESLSSAQDLLPFSLAHCLSKIVGDLWSLWLSKAIIHSLLIIHSDFGLPCILRCLKLCHHICWWFDNIEDKGWAENGWHTFMQYACMQH